MSRAPLRVAVLGAGTVGREVIRGLLEDGDHLAMMAGRPLLLSGVACRDLDRARETGIPAALLTDAPAHLVAGAETDVIVELMGGDEPARTLIAAALGAGLPVVTANKHVVAYHGPALEAAARRAGTAFRFEASVGGGIPVLGPMATDLAADRIGRVRGIVNGTTNFILTGMAEAARSYEAILADAQALGYAEADPRGDVEGDDAVNKLVILARLAFGQWLDPRSLGRRPPSVAGCGLPGIRGVTDRELAAAAAQGLTIRLLATAGGGARTDRGIDDVMAAVLPTAVPATGEFGRTTGVTNRIEIEAQPLGTVAMSGPGAGGAATASAVLGDLVAIARGLGSTWAGLPPSEGPPVAAADPLERPRRWFAFVPAASAVSGTAGSGASSATASVVALPDGVAIVTGVASLAEARTTIRPFLADGRDATLYPVDD